MLLATIKSNHFWYSSYINYPPIQKKNCIKENYAPFQANVEYFIIVMKKEDYCAQLKLIFTCHEQSYCSIP